MKIKTRISLGMALLVSFMGSESVAMSRVHDLYIDVVNATNAPIQVCNAVLTYCGVVEPGERFIDAQPTEGKIEESFAAFGTATVVKACGKIIPLNEMVGAPSTEELGDWWRKKRRFVLTVTPSSYESACRAQPDNGESTAGQEQSQRGKYRGVVSRPDGKIVLADEDCVVLYKWSNDGECNPEYSGSDYRRVFALQLDRRIFNVEKFRRECLAMSGRRYEASYLSFRQKMCEAPAGKLSP